METNGNTKNSQINKFIHILYITLEHKSNLYYNNDMNEAIKTAIKGVYYEFCGKRMQAIADLEVLLQQTVGVGDHANICEDIKKKYEEIDKYNSLLDTMNEQHHDITMGETDQRKVQETKECDDSCGCD
jgi:hypothetical protein